MAERLAGIGHFIRDIENDTIFWSPQIFSIFGLDQNQPPPRMKRFVSMIHPDDRQRLMNEIQYILSTGEGRIFEYRINRPDGAQRDIRSTIEAIEAPNGKNTRIRGILQDITKERIFKQRIAHVHRAEREAIYRDLHDSVCQELAGIGFLADSIQYAVRFNSRTVLKDVEKIISCTKKAINLASDIARNLSPLDEGDPAALNMALKALTSYIEDIYGVRCSIVSRKQVMINDHIVATHLFHIAREAVINAARHSQASRIRILLSRRKNKIILRVTDDGKGIKIQKKEIAGGLAIMRSRAAIIGAVLDIFISDKAGTVVECSLREKHE
jgi:signal transduction histidine kinase